MVLDPVEEEEKNAQAIFSWAVATQGDYILCVYVKFEYALSHRYCLLILVYFFYLFIYLKSTLMVFLSLLCFFEHSSSHLTLRAASFVYFIHYYILLCV